VEDGQQQGTEVDFVVELEAQRAQIFVSWEVKDGCDGTKRNKSRIVDGLLWWGEG
jgi:hypothetical protein